jgi:hypothetical protein
MCHGIILTYRCCGKQRNMFQFGGECEDGFCGTIWGGNKLTAPRRCKSCRIRKARAERRCGRRYQNNTRRAKAVLEYFRRDRATPFVDEEAQERALIAESNRNWELYERGFRLHPFVVASNSSQSIINTIGRHFDMEGMLHREDPFSTIRPDLFDECIRRQEEITASRRVITPVDRAFAFQIVVDGGVEYPEESHLEPEVAAAHLEEVSPLEYSEPEMVANTPNELFVVDTVGFRADHDIVALPTEGVYRPRDASAADAATGYYTEYLEETTYEDEDEAPLPFISFPQWLAGAADQDDSTLSSEAALERDLEDYEHSYLGLNVTWSQLVAFREARTDIQNRPFDFLPERRLLSDPPTLSFAAWLCVQQQANNENFVHALETYSTYIEEVASPEQQAAYRESRERRVKANRRFFNYEMLEGDNYDFFRPHNIITPSRPSRWVLSTARIDIMDFLNELAEGRHNPLFAPSVQQNDGLPPTDNNHWSENGYSENTLPVLEPEREEEHHADTPMDNTNVDLAVEETMISGLDDDSESEVENEDPVRVRANWFGTNSIWPPDHPGSTGAQNSRRQGTRMDDQGRRNARSNNSRRRPY